MAAQDLIRHAEATVAHEGERRSEPGPASRRELVATVSAPGAISSSRFRDEGSGSRPSLDAYILDGAHDEDNAEDHWQLVNGLFDEAANFVLGGGAFGVFGARHGWKGNHLGPMALREIED